MSEPAAGAIAVVGIGMVVPGASSPAEFWQLLDQGSQVITDPPHERWRLVDYVADDGEDKTYTQAGGFVTGLGAADPQQDFGTTWLRHCVVQALDGVVRAPADRFSLWVGYTADGSLHQEEALWRDEALAAVQASGRFAAATAGRLSVALAQRYARVGDTERYLPHRVAREAVRGVLPDDVRTHLIDTACSSSLYAVDLGAKDLVEGSVDIAVCGGALVLTPTSSVLFSKNGGLAPRPVVRALDAQADGVLFSDGAAVVVLKLLDRALADGDTVHGLVVATGLSADGRGKAIYAPSADGQRRAIDRSLRRAPSVEPRDVGLVVAHATGTPAGDGAELAALRDHYGGADGAGCRVVSNKSLIGHTGWAAGAVSIIHVLLALRHESIPQQHHFEQEAAAVSLAGTGPWVPRTTRPWARSPTPGRPRVAAVSGLGFGGTNAHLLVQEHGPGSVPVSGYGSGSASGDDVVVVGWAVHEPATGTGFGDAYPAPTPAELRLPGRTVRRIDRAQLMLVQCMHRLDPALRQLCAERNDRVGVVVGHCGPTRNALLYRSRAHLDEVARVLLAACDGTDDRLAVHEFLSELRAAVLTRVAAPTEDSYPGEMPNVIAGRLANYFDLRGLNVTVDQGEASLVEAVELAGRYLRFGDVDVALVGAVSGNSLPAFVGMLGVEAVHEAAYLFGLTTRGVAAAAGLPIHAVLAAGRAGEHRAPTARTRAWSLAGAEGGPELVAFLSGEGGVDLDLRRAPDPIDPERCLLLHREGAPASSPEPEPASAPAPAPGPDPANVLDRHVLRLAAEPIRAGRRAVPLFPDATLVVTNSPALVPAGIASVVVTADLQPTESDVERVVAEVRPRHVRVVVDLRPAMPPFDPTLPAHRAVQQLHDAMFLVLRALAPTLGADGSAVFVLLGGIDARRVLHPLTGLFTGFVKVLALEHPEPLVVAVAHDAADLAAAAPAVEAELGARRGLPVVYYAGGQRLVVRAAREPAPPAPLPLTQDSVVVAAGGARGIGAEVVKALADAVGPRIYVLGTSSVDGDAARDDLLVAEGKAAFIRANAGRTSVTAANAAFERLLRARETRVTLRELVRHCGAERVQYLRCDVRDREDVAAVVGRILHDVGQVDLLLNVAGLIRTAAIGRKTLEDFAAVRDVKLLAHSNLTRAFGRRRPVHWCNFGSYAGFFGAPGETDYAAANDFLYSAADHAAAEHPGEFTIGFTLWGEAGFASTGLWRSRMDSAALLTPMSTAEGVRHFMAELAAPATATVQLGPTERASMANTANTANTAKSVQKAPDSGAFCTDFGLEGVACADDCLRATRTFDLERDGYMLEHLVGGYATLPGSFYPELAAQAAALLCPDKVAVAFEDVRLESFLRVYGPDRPHTVQITAQRRAFDRVHVRVLHDVVGPNGQVLVRGRLHASLDVRLADTPAAAPRWPSFNRLGDEPAEAETLVNPLYLDSPAIRLAGMFLLTEAERRRPRADGGGQWARLRHHRADAERWFPDALTPMLTFEAIAQMLKVQPANRPMTIAVPRRIRLIEQFAADAEPSDLCCTPRDADLYLEHDDATNRGVAVAITSDGQVAARITGMHAVVLDRLPQESHRNDDRAAADQAR